MLLFLVATPGPAFSQVLIQVTLSWEHQDQLSTQRAASHGQEHGKPGRSSVSRDVVLLPFKTHLSLQNVTFTRVICYHAFAL